MTLEAYFREQSEHIDAALDSWLPPATTEPCRLHEAMRYSVMAGGKRVRPLLCLTVAAGFLHPAAENPPEYLLKGACALEILHTYSLIHDDLPAMDNDDLRRGKPTNHKVFGEALAILAGDALLTLAFEWLSDLPALGLPAADTLEVTRLFARAVGHLGMVGGQVFDMQSEGTPITLDELRRIHALKTGALLRAAVEMGAVFGKASPPDRTQIRVLGEKIGLLFQVTDDILDVIGQTKDLGKTPGKDQAQGKATYPALLGLDEARRVARDTHQEAKHILSTLSRPIPRLAELMDFLFQRSH
jgi:geranylgeranyl diphosphate synthase type II